MSYIIDGGKTSILVDGKRLTVDVRFHLELSDDVNTKTPHEVAWDINCFVEHDFVIEAAALPDLICDSEMTPEEILAPIKEDLLEAALDYLKASLSEYA